MSQMNSVYRIDSGYPGVLAAGGPPESPHYRAKGLAAILNPGVAVNLLDHFMPYRAGDWTITSVTGAVAQSDTEANGAITITPDNATNASGSQLQLLGGRAMLRTLGHPGEPDRLGVSARVKIANVAKADFFLGLGSTDTTIFAANAITLAQGIGLFMDDSTIAAATGSLSLFYKPTSLSSAVIVHGVVPMTNGEYADIGFRIDSNGFISVFKDGEHMYSTAAQTVLPDTTLRLSIASHNAATAGAANVTTWDYVHMTN